MAAYKSVLSKENPDEHILDCVASNCCSSCSLMWGSIALIVWALVYWLQDWLWDWLWGWLWDWLWGWLRDWLQGWLRGPRFNGEVVA